MISFISSLATLLLAGASRAVTVHNTYNVTVFYQDKLQFNMSDLFYTAASQNLVCSANDTNSTTIVTPTTVLGSVDLSSYHFADLPDVGEFVSNQTFYAIYDESTLLIQNITLDGVKFSNLTVATFGTPGVTQVCTDIHHNPRFGRIYVVCQSNFSNPKPWNWYVYELDDVTGATISTITQPQLDNTTVAHRLQIKYIEVLQPERGQPPVPIVIIYDQGLSSGITLSNRWIGVFTISRNSLAWNNYAWFSNQQDLTVNNLYDIFSYENHMIVSGKLQNSTILSLGYCNIYFDKYNMPQIECAKYTVQSQLNTTSGYWGLMNTGQLVEINTNDVNSSYIQICDLTDNFFSANFIDYPNCNGFPSFKLPEAQDAFIASVEGNIHQIVVKFTHPDSSYAGYSLHNFDMKYETTHIDETAAPIVIPLGKSLVFLGQSLINLYREVPPYAYIDASQLNFNTPQTVRITCTDSNNTATNDVALFVLGDMNNIITSTGVNLPDFDAYPGTDLYFQLDPHEVMGNNLEPTITLDPAVAANGRVSVYDLEDITINFVTESSSKRWEYLYFKRQYAIGKDTLGRILVFTCHLTDITDANCNQAAIYTAQTGNDILKPDVAEVFNYLFAWAVDPVAHTTKIYIFDGQHQISSFTINEMASDISVVELGDRAYIAAVFSQRGAIRNWFFKDGNPTSITEIESISRELSAREFFCPVNVSFQTSIIEGYATMEILSLCPQQDQRILRYQYPPYVKQNAQGHYYTVFNLMYTVPINLAYSNIQVCSVGTEHIIYATLSGKNTVYSVGMSDDRNVWNFGAGSIDEFNLGNLIDFSCTPESGMFTLVSALNNGTKIVSTWWGNNQYNAGHRLYRSVGGLDSYTSVKSYDWNGNVIHVLRKTDGTIDFKYTWIVGQVVEVSFFQSMPAGQVNVNYNFANSMKSTTFSRAVTARPTSTPTNATIDQTQVLGGYPTNVTIQIEKFTTFNGDVTEARITGTDLITLNSRVYRIGQFVPDEPELQSTYSHFETNGYTSVGVHTSPYNSSFFSIFFNINEYQGSYTPAHGVNDFHLAPFPNWDASTFLLAYSTAEPANNSLQLIVFNGSQAIATASSPASETHNYTDIKVLRLNSNAQGVEAFYVFGHNRQQGLLDIWVATYNTQTTILSLVPSPIPSDTDVGSWSFACINATESCLLTYASASNATLVMAYTFQRTYGVTGHFKKEVFSLNKHISEALGYAPLGGNFLIVDIECKTQNTTNIFCLFNTYGTRIVDLTYDLTNLPAGAVSFTYNKLQGFDGRYMDSTRDFLVYLGSSHPAHHPEQREWRYIFYKRGANGGNGNVFYTVHNDAPRPFTLTTCRHHNTHFQLTGSFPTVPVFFLALQNFSLNVMAGANYKQAQMLVEGVPGFTSPVQVAVSSFAGGYIPPTTNGSGSVWPYVVILGLLIGFSVGYAIYNSNKNKGEEAVEGSAANYQSLKNDAKTTTNEA